MRTMNIAVIGAGPAGLMFGGILKRRRPEWTVTVYEREKMGTTYGHGVVLPGRNQSMLASTVPEVFDRIRSVAMSWSDLEVRHKGLRLSCANNRFLGIRRARLLEQLHNIAAESRVDIRYCSEVPDPRKLREETDLLVAADGARSRTRNAWPQAFGARVGDAEEAFLWLSVPQSFASLCFPFEKAPGAGWIGVHAYPHGGGESTFIVEAPSAVVQRLRALDDDGLGPDSPLVHLFAEHLDKPLDLRTAQWRNFPNVRCERWFHENVVLIGDAAHTAHFSLGSGTGLAFGDAVALCDALCTHDQLDRALEAYNQIRRPAVEEFSQMSRVSQRWWEELDTFGELPPDEFIAHFMTRVPVVNRFALQLLDESFVTRLEQRRRTGAGATLPREWSGTIGSVTLPGRLVGDEETVRALGAEGAVRQGVGLVLPATLPSGESSAAASPSRDARSGNGKAPVPGLAFSLTDGQAVVPDSLRELRERDGHSPVLIRFDRVSQAGIEETLKRVRSAAQSAPIVCVFEAGDDAQAHARTAANLGAAAIGFGGSPQDLPRVVECCEIARASLGLPVLLDIPLADGRIADTLIMSGRVDFCGWRHA